LQCVAARCDHSRRVLQLVAVYCSVLQLVALCCSVLQLVVITQDACCSSLQCVNVIDMYGDSSENLLKILAVMILLSLRSLLPVVRAITPACCATQVCCSVLQCDTVCCSVLQCVAGCCSVLQCVVV